MRASLFFIPFLLMTPLVERSTSQPDVAAGGNDFALDLYHVLRKQNDGNIFFSPFSISTAFAMAYAGADGSTSDDIARVMHFGANTADFHSSYGDFLKHIEGSTGEGLQLRVANRLWGDHAFIADPLYLAMTKKAYASPLEQVDFKKHPDPARITINKWVADRTEQRIKDLIPDGAITEETRMVLTNAIYFKGDWLHAFDTTSTRKRDFHAATGTQQHVPFMHRLANMPYHETRHAKMVRIPYKGEKHSMIVVLPHRKGELEEVEASLDLAEFKRLPRSHGPEVNLALPKFKMTLPLTLGKTLKGMGMLAPFDDRADFSRMSPKEGLKISEVIHKAFIEVDEQGTEAAAATAIVMMTTSSAMPQPREIKLFQADHPFLFFITDDTTGAILFMGRITEI